MTLQSRHSCVTLKFCRQESEPRIPRAALHCRNARTRCRRINPLDRRRSSAPFSSGPYALRNRAEHSKRDCPGERDGVAQSRHGAEERDGRLFRIRSGSRNGTFLNGRRLVGPAGLRSGDMLAIGCFALLFSEAATSAPRPERGPQSDPAATRVHLMLRDITVLVVDIRDFTGLTRASATRASPK